MTDPERVLLDSETWYGLQDIPSTDPFLPNLPLPAGIGPEEEVQAELGI